jgi:NAD(P)-dependent dehydrogenase (short-subunit alcohol dehydrogenase family)
MKIEQWLKINTLSLEGKTIAITGSTGELLQEVVTTLAKLNANFILLNRNEEKTKLQIEKLNTLCPHTKAEFIKCDLENFESVKTATEILKTKKVDILYLGAGAYNIKRFKTKLSYDNVFQINFISQYYIAKEMFPYLDSVNGKIVAVSSIAYNYSSIDESDIDFSTRKKHSKVYGNAKRFLTFSLHELLKSSNVEFSVVHPGVTLTPMTNHYPKFINGIVKLAIKIFFPSVKKASLSLVWGVFVKTNYHYWIGPKTLNVWGFPKVRIMKNISNEESGKIFKIAENIYENIEK